MFTNLGIALLTISSSIILCIVPVIYCVTKCQNHVVVVPVDIPRNLPQNRHEEVPPQNAVEIP